MKKDDLTKWEEYIHDNLSVESAMREAFSPVPDSTLIVLDSYDDSMFNKIAIEKIEKIIRIMERDYVAEEIQKDDFYKFDIGKKYNFIQVPNRVIDGEQIRIPTYDTE